MHYKTTKHWNSFWSHCMVFHPWHKSRRSNPDIDQMHKRVAHCWLLSIWELQWKPQFVKWKRSENSLEVKAMVARPDRSKLPIVVLVDSGCSSSTINETFIKENKLLTHDIPIPIPIYNADGTMNKGGSISKFTMVELIINNHSEWLPLAITSLSTHAVSLGFDWLKIHNPEIDWKNQKLDRKSVV